MEPQEERRSRAELTYRILSPLWPDAGPMLRYRDPFELVCAVALSAQCTDEQVNKATPGLFASWPTPAAMAAAKVEDVEAAIRSLGFFHTKARHLVEAAHIMQARFGGTVPSTMAELLALPGVGSEDGEPRALRLFRPTRDHRGYACPSRLPAPGLGREGRRRLHGKAHCRAPAAGKLDAIFLRRESSWKIHVHCSKARLR